MTKDNYAVEKTYFYTALVPKSKEALKLSSITSKGAQTNNENHISNLVQT